MTVTLNTASILSALAVATLVQIAASALGMYIGYRLHEYRLNVSDARHDAHDAKETDIYNTLNDHGNRIVRIETICKVRHQEHG